MRKPICSRNAERRPVRSFFRRLAPAVASLSILVGGCAPVQRPARPAIQQKTDPTKLVKQLATGNVLDRMKSIDKLLSIASRNPEHPRLIKEVPAIIRALTKIPPGYHWSAKPIFSKDHKEVRFDFYIEPSNPEVVRTAQELERRIFNLLTRIGKPATPALIKVLKGDNDWLVRAKAAEALGKIRDVRAVPELRRAAKNDRSDVVMHMAEDAVRKILGD